MSKVRSYGRYNYKTLHKIEVELNSIKYEKIELGRLLSNYFNVIYYHRSYSWLKKLYLFFKSIFKISFSKKNFNHKNKKILYYCSGQINHLEKIKSALSSDKSIKDKTLFINDHSDLCDNDIFYKNKLVDLFDISLYLIRQRKKILEIMKPLNFSIFDKVQFAFELQLQLLKAISLINLMKKLNELNLVVGDYDRGYESSIVFAVANALNIKSIVLQHGTLNPPIGYTPVNANEIWVWGEMTKAQLLKLGVSSNRIRITGNPIISKLNTSLTKKQKTKIFLKKENYKENVVLALSAPDKKNDIKQVEFLAALKRKDVNSKYNYYVKIHPARDYNKYQWIVNKFNISILPHKISLEEFIGFVDILLTHSSGLANELIFHNKKVCILDILKTPPLNGMELHKYLKIPLITESTTIDQLVSSSKISDASYLFKSVGSDAVRDIQNKIREEIIFCQNKTKDMHSN